MASERVNADADDGDVDAVLGDPVVGIGGVGAGGAFILGVARRKLDRAGIRTALLQATRKVSVAPEKSRTSRAWMVTARASRSTSMPWRASS